MKEDFRLKDTNISVVPTDFEKMWETPWKIYRNYDAGDPGKEIGYVTFAGEKERGTVPISIEIYDPCDRNQGFGTKAIRLMTEWAFGFSNVYEITAQTEHENSSYIMALQKAGYVQRSYSKGTEKYSIVKPKTAWTGLYLAIGIVVSFIIGYLFNNVWIGVVLGLLICLILGSSMDYKERKFREAVTGKVEKRRKKD